MQQSRSRAWLEAQRLTPEQWKAAAQRVSDMAHRHTELHDSLRGRSAWKVKKFTGPPRVTRQAYLNGKVAEVSWQEVTCRAADRLMLGASAEQKIENEARVAKAVERARGGK